MAVEWLRISSGGRDASVVATASAASAAVLLLEIACRLILLVSDALSIPLRRIPKRRVPREMPQVSENLYHSRPRNIPLFSPPPFASHFSTFSFSLLFPSLASSHLLDLRPWHLSSFFFICRFPFRERTSIFFLASSVIRADSIHTYLCTCIYAPSVRFTRHNLIARLVLWRRRVPRQRIAFYRLRTSFRYCSMFGFKNRYQYIFFFIYIYHEISSMLFSR